MQKVLICSFKDTSRSIIELRYLKLETTSKGTLVPEDLDFYVPLWLDPWRRRRRALLGAPRSRGAATPRGAGQRPGPPPLPRATSALLCGHCPPLLRLGGSPFMPRDSPFVVTLRRHLGVLGINFTMTSSGSRIFQRPRGLGEGGNCLPWWLWSPEAATLHPTTRGA